MRNAQPHFVVAQSMALTITSSPLDIRNMLGTVIQANYVKTGALSGVFKLQISVDHVVDQAGRVTNDGTWNDLTGSSLTISDSGSYIWDTIPTCIPFIRLVYTPGGGDTGTLDAWAFSKGNQ